MLHLKILQHLGKGSTIRASRGDLQTSHPGVPGRLETAGELSATEQRVQPEEVRSATCFPWTSNRQIASHQLFGDNGPLSRIGVSLKVLVFMLIACSAANAQNVQTPAGGVEAEVVVGLPFSGNASIVTLRTLNEKSQVSHSIAYTFYRDNQGRTRVERESSNMDPWSESNGKTVITIIDVIARLVYSLDPARHTAVTTSLRTTPGPLPIQESGGVYKVTVTSLGTRTIMGFPCTGTQTSHAVAAGEGSDGKQSANTWEQWYSSDLKIVLQSTSTDNNGSIKFEFQTLSRLPPDPLLFQIPGGYTVSAP